MKGKVAQSRKHRKQKKVDRLTKAERRARLAQRHEQWLEQFIGVAEAFMAMLLNAEVKELLGRPANKWGDRSAQVQVNASCNGCGRKQQGWFRRNGTYPRSSMIEGLVIDFRVPRVRCACGGAVDVSFSVFAPYERVNLELAERLREAMALGQVAEMKLVSYTVFSIVSSRDRDWSGK